MKLLIDAHAHLDHIDFKEDIDQVIERARKNNVKAILNAGLDPKSNRKTLELAEQYDIIKACLGIYPIEVLTKESKKINRVVSSFDIGEEIEFIKRQKEKMIAIGEVGLDYFWTQENTEKQKGLFAKMIKLAESLNKPIIVHSRKAEKDCIEMLESSRLKNVVMHCFSGKKNEINKVIDNGWYFSIPANIVHSFQFQGIVKNCALSKILTETDAPYLSPFKGKRNEPSFIVESIKKIAELKNMNQEEVCDNIFMNYQKVFL